jgi:DNA-binding MarR family transcriptional regulator
MSRDSVEGRTELLAELARELRQFTGLSASFFRAASGRIGMTVTDMQVIDALDLSGPTTAGQLADLTGLTTGAITGMLNRLEEAGLVRRERDPSDGRRVIVRLTPGKDEMRAIGSIFDSSQKEWDDKVSRYDDEQIALLLEFLRSCNEVARKEIVQLRETPEREGGTFSAELGDLQSAQLVVSSGISQLTLRADATIPALYQARFEGPVPEVKAINGVVTIRYPRRLWPLDRKQNVAEVTLNAAIPWQIVFRGGAAQLIAELGNLDLSGLEVHGGLGSSHLELPVPSGTVPIQIYGGASQVTVRRPAGVEARVHLKGWASTFIFDDQMYGAVGNDLRLQSSGYDTASRRYDIDVNTSASMVTITSA